MASREALPGVVHGARPVCMRKAPCTEARACFGVLQLGDHVHGAAALRDAVMRDHLRARVYEPLRVEDDPGCCGGGL